MGWASGSGLAQDIWDSVRKSIPVSKRKKIARDIIDLFENQDCDTIDEAELLCKDAGRVRDEDLDETVYR